MRKTILLSLVLLVSAAWAVAQQDTTSSGASQTGSQATQSAPSTTQTAPGASGSSSGQSSQTAPQGAQSAPPSSSSDQAAAGPDTLSGCLGGTAPNFTLVDKTGTTYQLKLPQSANAAALTPHVGEEVQVAGTIEKSGSNAPSGGSASSASSGGASSNQPTIAITKMGKVSDTCSNTAKTK